MQFLDTTLWQVQGETYGCVPLTEDMVVVSFQQAGFSILEKKIANLPPSVPEEAETPGDALFIVARAD